MVDGTNQLDNERYLGIDTKLVAQTEVGQKSGIRRLEQEIDPLKKITSGLIDGYRFRQQDLMINSSSSSWKEQLLDKKVSSGVLLNNNIVLWFEANNELNLSKTEELVKEKYPNTKIDAKFTFGEKGAGTGSTDISIRSTSEFGDHNAFRLMEYFGRSLDFKETVSASIVYQDRQKEQFSGSLQEFLFLDHH